MDALRRMRPLLGTYVEVGARGMQAASAIEAAFAAIEAAQRDWSFHDAGSALSRLNRNPATRVALCRNTLRLLRAARAMMRASEGAFDCTIGGELVRRGALPDHGGPPCLARGEAEDIDIGPDWAMLRRPVRLSLDGIAKGYAVDLAVAALRRHGADAGWVNAGGDMRVTGDIALPVQRREHDGSLTDLGALREAALASSRTGAAEPEFAALIVGPATAPPAGVWTVIAKSAWRADALTKVAANLPEAVRSARIKALGGCLVLSKGELQ